MKTANYILLICLLAACQIRRPPHVSIISPAQGQEFRVGDTVHVRAELSDADILMGQYLTVVSGRNYTDTVLKFEDHVQQGTYHLSNHFVVGTNDTFKVIVSAWGGSSVMTEKQVLVLAH